MRIFASRKRENKMYELGAAVERLRAYRYYKYGEYKARTITELELNIRVLCDDLGISSEGLITKNGQQ